MPVEWLDGNAEGRPGGGLCRPVEQPERSESLLPIDEKHNKLRLEQDHPHLFRGHK